MIFTRATWPSILSTFFVFFAKKVKISFSRHYIRFQLNCTKEQFWPIKPGFVEFFEQKIRQYPFFFFKDKNFFHFVVAKNVKILFSHYFIRFQINFTEKTISPITPGFLGFFEIRIRQYKAVPFCFLQYPFGVQRRFTQRGAKRRQGTLSKQNTLTRDCLSFE